MILLLEYFKLWPGLFMFVDASAEGFLQLSISTQIRGLSIKLHVWLIK